MAWGWGVRGPARETWFGFRDACGVAARRRRAATRCGVEPRSHDEVARPARTAGGGRERWRATDQIRRTGENAPVRLARGTPPRNAATGVTGVTRGSKAAKRKPSRAGAGNTRGPADGDGAAASAGWSHAWPLVAWDTAAAVVAPVLLLVARGAGASSVAAS